jgi:hypothetical protein
VAGGAPPGGTLGPFCAACVLLSLCVNSLAHAVAHASPALPQAQTVGYLLQAVMLLFGGLLVPAPALPAGWAWLMAASPLSHAANAVWRSFFYCASNPSLPGGGCRTFVQLPVPSPIVESDFVVGWLGLQAVSVGAELGVLGIFWAAYTAGALACAQLVSHVRR